jgi:hypothetical protein
VAGGLRNISSCTVACKFRGEKHSRSLRYVDGLFRLMMFFG